MNNFSFIAQHQMRYLNLYTIFSSLNKYGDVNVLEKNTIYEEAATY